MDELFFLIGINEDENGNTVNMMSTYEKWNRLLTMARANGWKPRGTVLDVEFQLNLELSYLEETDAVNLEALRKQIEERCRRWRGGISDSRIPDRKQRRCRGHQKGNAGD